VVTWTVTDNAGNTSSATQNVIVEDNTNPTIVAPADLTVNADNNCEAVIANLGNAVATDNCTTVTVTNDGLAAFPLGTTVVTWTATDAAGNTATATQTITVVDNTVPTIAAPADVIVSADMNCEATGVVLGSPVTADNCGVASVANNAPIVFPIGTTVVTWTVTDNSGNIATTTQEIVVIDDMAPVVTAPADVTVSTNLGCEAIGVVLGSPVVTDNCTVGAITNDAPMIYPLGTTIVNWAVTDVAGNSTTVTQQVIVQDTEAPTITVPSDLEVISNSGCDATGVALGTPVTDDNCGIASVVNDAPAVFPSGTTVVTWTVTDNSGNQSTASQIVTVLDLVPPTADLIDISINLPVGMDAMIDETMIDNGSFDNCGGVTITLSNYSFNCDNLGDNIVEVTIIDQAGNSTVAEVTVTVLPSGIDQDFDGVDDACDEDIIDFVKVPNGFTPDGDGINDMFVIPGIDSYSNVRLTIFNRYGNLVYENSSYENNWDGSSNQNGQLLPDGTYYYVLELDNAEQKSGYVYINRVY
jgi:gliding motility-associated-like protein